MVRNNDEISEAMPSTPATTIGVKQWPHTNTVELLKRVYGTLLQDTSRF